MTDAPLVIEIPDLAGEGWCLRRWRPDDASSLVRAWHDPAIIEGSTPPDDRSEQVARSWIESCEERRLAGVAFDVVIANAVDAVVGEFGLSRLDPTRRAAVAGWWVHAEARGQGLASAVIEAVVTHLLAGPLDAMLAEIDPANEASVALARHAGFAELTDPRNSQETARGTGPRVWYVANSTVK